MSQFASLATCGERCSLARTCRASSPACRTSTWIITDKDHRASHMMPAEFHFGGELGNFANPSLQISPDLSIPSLVYFMNWSCPSAEVGFIITLMTGTPVHMPSEAQPRRGHPQVFVSVDAHLALRSTFTNSLSSSSSSPITMGTLSFLMRQIAPFRKLRPNVELRSETEITDPRARTQLNPGACVDRFALT
jgi:hypothetical protein